MPASYMNYFTAYEVLTLDGGTGKATFTHNLYTRTGLPMAKQIVNIVPVSGVAHVLVPQIDLAVAQTGDTVSVIGSAGATVKVTVQAVHSIQQ